MNTLRLWKGQNNGITLGSVVEIDEDGEESIFDLTSATVALQIYERSGKVICTIAGTVVSASEGTYKAFPDADDLDSLVVGQSYYWSTKITNATYPQGRVFAEDSDGNLQPVIVMGKATTGV
jgi:hypothetical protein